MAPLHNMSQAKDKEFQWTAQLQTSFDNTKEALASATLLVHPSPTAATSLNVDASDLAVGGVLEQYIDGEWKPSHGSWTKHKGRIVLLTVNC